MKGELSGCYKHPPSSNQNTEPTEGPASWLTPFLSSQLLTINLKPIHFSTWFGTRWFFSLSSTVDGRGTAIFLQLKAALDPYGGNRRGRANQIATLGLEGHDMASATMREISKSRKVSKDHPSIRHSALISLRDFVQRRYPQHYRLSCDYEVDDRTIYRSKRFNGSVVDRRPIGEVPVGMLAADIIFEDFRGTVLGEPEAITRIAKLEQEFWSISNEIASLFCGEGVLA